MTTNLKILAILPESIGGRLTTSSIIDGFRALGHELDVVDLLFLTENGKWKMENGKLAPLSTLHSSLCSNLPLSNDYDYILSYDFSAIKFAKKNGLSIKTINYFSDVIEDPHSGADWAEYYDELKNPRNFVFYWDKELTAQKKGEIPNLFYLPHFVNTDIYKNLNIKPEYDIMFAGRLDTDYRLNSIMKIIKQFPKHKFAWYAIEKHLDDACSRLANESDKKLLSKIYAGFIDNENDMAIAINKTKIVLNFNQQGISSLNYRTMQTLACSKLIINDYRTEGLELFGANYVYYKDLGDLSRKLEFFLNDEINYKKITQGAAEIVRREQSHIAGVSKIISAL